ncbi:RNA dependent RNA polymerase-domain-containing protein [Flammula alnicola]|nr:RNA dependent RNA polymerase-domain-containing protein [Flammula alnicola]
MELFMRNVDWNVDKSQVTAHLATLLHDQSNFHDLFPTRMNFHVHLHPDKRRVHKHGGTGALTLPNSEIANRFLELFGADGPHFPVVIGQKTVFFSMSRRPKGRNDVLEKILKPYMDPWVAEQRERRAVQLRQGRISINILQFGWECRDYVFSIESETYCDSPASLTFSDERRELRIELQQDFETYFIAIHYSHINETSVHHYLETDPVIFFSLNTPPTYERNGVPLRQRLSFLPIPDHQRVAPYASLAIRLVCTSANDLQEFRRLSGAAQLHRISNYECPVERREIFSAPALEKLQGYLRRFNWCISFQIEALLRSMAVDVKEVLDLVPQIARVLNQKGKAFTAAMLPKFAARAKIIWDEEEAQETNILQCFLKTEKDVAKQSALITLKPSEGSLYDAYHVTITPTTMFLDGPFPERSNRVIRAYEPIHQESFLRVSFLDEAKLQYRFDREVDGPEFIRARVGPLLLAGLTIAGRKFKFLAYSQSALKEHAVWFVKPFRDSLRGFVNAESIVKSLGTFEGLRFDRDLIYCPARYAARLSQAFTATDAVQIEVEEIMPIEDIYTSDRKYQFTDGVGTLSKELAREIWAQLKKRNDEGAAYQIRFRGSKGMLSVDYKLSGMAICLRPSMTKFVADEWTAIEIARAFDRPGTYFLNRPLIMLLEGLGVPFEVFEQYQNLAVLKTKNAGKSLGEAAALFESHGLGASYRLTSIMLNLEKLGITSLPDDRFYTKFLEYAIHHVLRDLKNHARIPVPGAWTLVGIADVHKYLKAGEIFACIKPVNGKTEYLEGPVLISRSPTIHPGDVMIVNAIGRPQPGSCFHAEPLPNTVVFSVLGERPVPSCLGGGDLDGDVVRPRRQHPPADYDPAPKKMVDHPSTMADVANFVMEYINSDVVGVVAINWLIIADQSGEGIFDTDCMKLASLHSNAVDYPKSGQPVALTEIPKPKHHVKPDWHAPETVDVSSGDFYESPKAIGRLFRAIDLPVEQRRSEQRSRQRRAQGRPRPHNTVEDLTEALHNFNLNDATDDYFIDTDIDWPADEVDFISQLFTSYASELRGICIANTLSHARTAHLSEEEAVVGTIDLAGDNGITKEEYLKRSWMAWKQSIARARRQEFGAQSFGWVALGAIFDAIREIEESMG